LSKKMILIAALLLSLIAAPVYAADSASKDASHQAVDSSPVEIVLQLNSPAISVNDVTSEIEPPYLSQSTTLVPLRVITSSLGAVLEWDGATQSIVLTYGDKRIKLVIGSNSAEINGVAAKIPAAPELKNGTTMVPLRFIVEYFGAAIAFESLTAPMRITGNRWDAAGADGSEIDSDAGKTRIGDSYYQWTMNYPTGLITSYHSFLEDSYQFQDANGEYWIWVEVESDQDDPINSDRLLQNAADLIDGTLLQKSYVNNDRHPEQSHALIVSKDSEGDYQIVRSYQWNHRVYDVWLMIDKPEDYKNADKLKKYTELLDSFTPTFDAADRELKDLSGVKDGYRPFIGSDLGLDLSVPADWGNGSNNEWTYFYGTKGDQGVNIRRTSVVQGDMLDRWIEREVAFLTDDYQPEFIKMSSPTSLTIAGLDAKLLNYSTSEDGKKWNQVYGYYLFDGDYKYEIDFLAFRSEQDAQQVSRIVDSIERNPSGNEEAGIIQDGRDFIDRMKMSTRKFEDSNYSIRIPDYWGEASIDDNTVTFSSTMGSISLFDTDNFTVSQFKQIFDNLMDRNKQLMSDFRVTSTSNITFGGVPAYKYVYSGTSDGMPFETTSYFMEKDNHLYGLDFILSKAHASEKNRAVQQAILDSFTFLK